MGITLTDNEDTKEIDSLLNDARKKIIRAFVISSKYDIRNDEQWKNQYYTLDRLYQSFCNYQGDIATFGRQIRERDPYNDGS